MIILKLQYDTHRGPDAIGQHKMTFTMDESIATDFNPMSIKKGTQFIVMMIEATSKEAEEFVSETPEETKERFRKHMNSLINQVAELKGEDPKVWREKFKQHLITNKIIKQSTTELDLQGYARVIADLKQQKHELEN